MSTKIAVITGAGRGLGLALAKEFTKNSDWQVVGTGLSEASIDFPKAAEYKQFDASNADECAHFWKEIVTNYPDAEICLVNNAGGYIGGTVAETPSEEFEKILRMNYFPAVYMTQALVKAVERARIITVVSATALTPQANNTAYGASKSAEQYFFQALQDELDHHKFPITNIYPNAIATRGPDPKAMLPEELANFVYEQAAQNKTYYIRDVTLYSYV